MERISDFEKLKLASEMAGRYKEKNVEVVELLNSAACGMDFNGYYSDAFRELSFHPNGNSGCIHLPDDYMYGIRCDHLMWIEGSTEGCEEFWSEADEKYADKQFDIWEKYDHAGGYDSRTYECILLIGNHKGTVNESLIVFHHTDDEV
jgi:hypothetical protein